MNDDVKPSTVQAVQTLYDQNLHAKQLFDWDGVITERRDGNDNRQNHSSARNISQSCRFLGERIKWSWLWGVHSWA